VGLDTLLTLLFVGSIAWSLLSGVLRAAGEARRGAREAAERARVEGERRRAEREADPDRRSFEGYLGRNPEARPAEARASLPAPGPGPEGDQELLRRATAAKMGRTLADDAREGRLRTAPPPRPAPRPPSPEGLPRPEEGENLERFPAPPSPELRPPPRRSAEPRTPLGAPETEVGRLARFAREERAVRAEASGPAAEPTVKRGTPAPGPRDIVRAIVWSEVLGPPKSRRR
jgi:hypothetical protein